MLSRYAEKERSKHYVRDDDGQWWYYTPAGNRTRCKTKTCEWCGEEYQVSPYHAKKSRFCTRSCSTRAQHHRTPPAGQDARRWNGGKTKRRGYVMVFMPDHHSIPANTTRKYVLEHRLVMEEMLGRPLRAEERVHHKNGVRDDNRPENLELWTLGHSMPGVRAGVPCPCCGGTGVVPDRSRPD